MVFFFLIVLLPTLASTQEEVIESWRDVSESDVTRFNIEETQIDRLGNFYVTGTYSNPDNIWQKTVKYDPFGEVLWERAEIRVRGQKMAVDGRQNVYVMGSVMAILWTLFKRPFGQIPLETISKHPIDVNDGTKAVHKPIE